MLINNTFKSLFSIFILISLSFPAFAAKSGQVISHISFGGYQATDGQDTVDGSQLSIGLYTYFTDQWSFFFHLSDGSATGRHTENSVSTDLSASMTTLSGGFQWSYDISINSDGKPDFVPYIGAGMSLQNYSYDFNYSGSKTGKVSGTGYGPLFLIGLKINLADFLVVIPGFHYDQIYIETEQGNQSSVTSSGYSLALVLRF